MFSIFNLYVSRRTLALVVVESLLITTAVLCGVGIRLAEWNSGFLSYLSLRDFALQALVFAGAFQICFYCCHLYDRNAFQRRIDEVIAMGQSIGSACLLLALVYFVFPDLLLGRGVFLISIVLTPVFLVASRRGLESLWRRSTPAENVLIVGNGCLAAAVAAELEERRDLNARVAGFFSPGGRGATADAASLRTRDLGESLCAAVERERIGRIVVALEDRRNVLPIRDLVRLRVQGVRVEDAHTTMSALTGRVWLATVKPSWFVFSDGFRRSALTGALKRAVDLAIATIGLVVSLPVMAVVAAAIRAGDKGPILYRQTRVGLRGKHFELLKFRSMRTDAEASGARWAVDNDPRVTRVGKFLRKYRLDELPQWINVIRADMSLVGPRPERPEFVEELRSLIPYYDERHSVRPGLSGWAQVQYRYGASVEDAIRKLEYDLFYLKNMSITFDTIILLKTVRIVITGEGSK